MMVAAEKSRFRPRLMLSFVIGCLSISVLRWSLTSELLHNYLDEMFPRIQDPDEHKDIEALIVTRGYEFARHEIVTSDGYHIELHQLWNPQALDKSQRPVVIGAHLLGTSNSYVMDPAGTAFVYADAGFDVWLVNNRGTRYGRKHKTLDPDNHHYDFHEFTIVELSAIDLAEQLDYIIQQTGHKKVNFVGVSQGAASLFALLSKKPSYNDVIAKASSYGGFRSFCHTPGLRYALMGLPYELFGDYLFDFVPARMVLDTDLSFCGRFTKLCEFSAVNLLGFESNYYLNITRMGVYGKNFPAGSSLRNFMWYGQSRGFGCGGDMREFDHDFGFLTRLLIKLGLRKSKNLEVYGTPEPPVLDPKNIKVDLKMYYSDGDVLIPEKEAQRVRKDLNIPEKNFHRIPDWRFSHFNFVIRCRPHAIDEHSINFFKGIESDWNPESSENVQ